MRKILHIFAKEPTFFDKFSKVFSMKIQINLKEYRVNSQETYQGFLLEVQTIKLLDQFTKSKKEQ